MSDTNKLFDIVLPPSITAESAGKMWCTQCEKYEALIRYWTHTLPEENAPVTYEFWLLLRKKYGTPYCYQAWVDDGKPLI